MKGWERFLSEAESLLAEARPDAAAEAAAGALGAFALDAAVLDMPEVARLAMQLVHALEAGEGADLASPLAVLRATLAELQESDPSGPQYDLAAVKRASEEVGAGAPRTMMPPPTAMADAPPLPGAAPTPDDSAWQPTVDDDMVDPFLEECHDRLESLSARLLELERRPDDAESVRAVFRDLHTLKGSAGFVGLTKMARLAHAAEDLVGLVRDGKREADKPVIDALLASLDVLQAIVSRAADRAPIDVSIDAVVTQLRNPKAAAGTASASATPSQSPSQAPKERAPIDLPAARASQTLRIDFAKLDELMNLVGELVLSKGRVRVGLEDLASLGRELESQRRGARRGGRRGSSGAGGRRGPVVLQDLATELGRVQRAFDSLSGDLTEAHQQLEFVSAQLRDQVMKLRMVPVGKSWTKYHRTVRQIAGSLGKDVRLELHGEDTELDKVLVEQLDDPLLHIVRNAVDHGVEPPDEREAAGKSPEGRLTLRAFHRGNQIVIRVEDDGRGIDVEKVRAKAVERGLLSPQAAAELEDAQVFDLIFAAGFSTAEKVSDLSGRGVGMDVVREAIARLKGTVHVESELGRGTVFELRLPLTLAIVQVLLVRAAGQTYAVPLDLVRRTLAADPASVRSLGHQETLLEQGKEIPLLRLRHVLALRGAAGEVPRELPIVLVEVGSGQVALACDAFLGRQEIVLKSLGSLLQRVPGAAGATLIGDRPALILDVPTIVRMAMTDPKLSRARPETVAPPRMDDEPESASPRILVVEDADVIREAIRRALIGAGYVVTTARDGAEGLRIAQSEPVFDLVSTDVVMPNMDGYELTRRLRALPAYRDVPIIMVTSKDERIDRIRGFDAGVDAYLAKPTDAEELRRVVARHLRREA